MNSTLFADDNHPCAPAFSFKVPPAQNDLCLAQQDSATSDFLPGNQLAHWKVFNESAKFDCCNLTGAEDSYAPISMGHGASTCHSRNELSEQLD